MRGRKLNNKGFSLVELIIAIAIMAILAGVLAPGLLKYIEKSRIATLEKNAKTIYDSANVTIIEYFGNNVEFIDDQPILGAEQGANQFKDQDTGEIVGRITSWTICKVLENPENPNLGNAMDVEFGKLITEVIGGGLPWAEVVPSGHAANYHDGKYYLQITYNLNGICTVELCRNGFYTIYDGAEFQTSKYSSRNQVSFHNVVQYR